MNRDQARVLITQTFTQAFDGARFRNFAQNLVNHIDESKAQRWNATYVKGKRQSNDMVDRVGVCGG